MAPKKNSKITSSSTRAARIKGGSNPVVTKGEARTRAARTTLGPAPKQRPMATGGTKGPLQGGTRSPGLKMNASKMEAGPAKVGPNLGQQSTASSAGPKAARPLAESRIRSMEAKPATVKGGMSQQSTLSSKPGANAARAQAAKDAARMANRVAKGYGGMSAIKGGLSTISNLKTGVAGLALGGLSDKYLSPLARKAGTALGKNVVIPAARALDDAMPGMNSRDERMRSNTKAAKTGNKSRFAGARDLAFAKAKNIKGSPVLGGKKSVAASFDKAFTAARKAGKSGFTFKGKKYTAKMK